MSDVLAIGVFVGCLLATLGLVHACAWLMPRLVERAAGRDDAHAKEAGQ